MAEVVFTAKLYLITGFLGAGKTTFLHQFARLFSGCRSAIIINEFGEEGIDGTLLADLNMSLSEISDGSIFCSCKMDQFEEALLDLQEQQLDYILVEASGLSDPSSIETILGQDDIFPDIAYGGAICLIDAAQFMTLYRTAPVCRMQLAISDLVLLNKSDLATRRQLDEITAIAKGQKPHRPVYETRYGHMEKDWLAAMEAQSSAFDENDDAPASDSAPHQLSITISGFCERELASFLEIFAEETLRVNGFVSLPGGRFMVDCVGPLVKLHPFSGPAPEENTLIVLYGNDLPAREAIEEACSWFPHATVILSSESPAGAGGQAS